MGTSVVEIAGRLRPYAAAPCIVCAGVSPADKDQAWTWVFREDRRNRLEPLWAGTLGRPEVDELVELLARQGAVWRGAIDGRHAPPSRWYRLVWTLAPAPRRIYRRRGLVLEVEPALVPRRESTRMART